MTGVVELAVVWTSSAPWPPVVGPAIILRASASPVLGRCGSGVWSSDTVAGPAPRLDEGVGRGSVRVVTPAVGWFLCAVSSPWWLVVVLAVLLMVSAAIAVERCCPRVCFPVAGAGPAPRLDEVLVRLPARELTFGARCSTVGSVSVVVSAGPSHSSCSNASYGLGLLKSSPDGMEVAGQPGWAISHDPSPGFILPLVCRAALQLAEAATAGRARFPLAEQSVTWSTDELGSPYGGAPLPRSPSSLAFFLPLFWPTGSRGVATGSAVAPSALTAW